MVCKDNICSWCEKYCEKFLVVMKKITNFAAV